MFYHQINIDTSSVKNNEGIRALKIPEAVDEKVAKKFNESGWSVKKVYFRNRMDIINGKLEQYYRLQVRITCPMPRLTKRNNWKSET